MTAKAGRLVAAGLVAATVGWPVVLASAVQDHAPAWRAVVYLAAARVCHQQPERSFHTAGQSWPVCARCSGLYLAAPFGAVLAGLGFGRRGLAGRARLFLALAAVPTAVTLGLEWLNLLPMTNAIRFLAALPLGAAVALVIVDLVRGPDQPIGYTQRP
ncbi:MAG TPA: DUF2085 domain-containing protein [Vicinamibacterales bacterium]|nr:DUF2085 domain-containing protein [Vicinamibacterales bacterium]